MLLAHKHGLPVPVPIFTRNSDGQQTSVLREQLDPLSTDRFAIRLLTFLDGTMLVNITYDTDILTKGLIEKS